MDTRVIAIEFAWIDPWTEEWCCGWRMPWDKRKAARSYYSRQIKNMKRWAKEFCTGPRTPKLKLKIIRSAA
jgi:hypothetical protein